MTDTMQVAKFGLIQTKTSIVCGHIFALVEKVGPRNALGIHPSKTYHQLCQ